MNLYKFHKTTASLNHYEDTFEFVPELVWGKYIRNNEELKKREDLWSRDAEYAYQYAYDIIEGPFPKGEDAIAKDADKAYWYAMFILKGPFPKGEDVILNSEYKDSYLKLIGKLK